MALSHRAQIGGAAGLATLLLWCAAASCGLAWSAATHSRNDSPALSAALAKAQTRIQFLDQQYAVLERARSQALSQALGQAEQMRDAAIVQAAAAREAADAARRDARQADHDIAANNTRIVNQLIAQTQLTIGEVDAIIRATGLDPTHLAAQAVQVNAPAGPLAAAPASLAREAGEVDRQLGQSLMPPDEHDAATALLRDTAHLQVLAAAFQQMPLIPPLARIAISSPFGYRASPFTGAREFHVGIDLTGPVGTPVYATAPGVVTYAGVGTGYGNLIMIDHGYGLSTRYSHLEKILVPVGALVSQHQEIGLLGNTGWSTGPHLLYETRVDGAPRNPLDFMKVTANVQN